jgi:hypothetical protein
LGDVRLIAGKSTEGTKMVVAEAWHTLERAVGTWVSHPTKRPYTGWVTAGPGGSDGYEGQQFVAEASYFSVRLVELSLGEGGKYFAEFLPLGVCLTEYTVGPDRQRSPLILNNDFIANQLQGAGASPGYVEYTNMYAVRRAPVKADNLSLFVGLFRMPYHDLAKQVLQLAADLTDQVGAGAGTRVAEKVYDRIAQLFQLNIMTPRFGFVDGSALTRSGYLLVAGPAARELTPERLRVIDNRLHVDGRRAEGFDYCLVALEHTATLLPQGNETINPLVDLTFHRRWRAISQLLALRKFTEAETEMPQLQSEVVVSPQLTEEDRLLAIAAYNTNYEKLHRMFALPTGAGGATRAGRAGQTASALRGAARDRKAVGQNAASRVLDQVATRLQIAETPSDPDAVFAREVVTLRPSLTGEYRSSPLLAATIAEAISGAVARR